MTVLQAMTIVYRKCHEIIGAFSDTQFIFQNLEKTNERTERDRLVQFIEVLMNNERNAKLLLDCNGIKILIELLSLAHLHTTRATVPLQSNLLEASPEMSAAASEKEWYYTLADNKKQGPVSFDEVKELHSKGSDAHCIGLESFEKHKWERFSVSARQGREGLKRRIKIVEPRVPLEDFHEYWYNNCIYLCTQISSCNLKAFCQSNWTIWLLEAIIPQVPLKTPRWQI